MLLALTSEPWRARGCKVDRRLIEQCGEVSNVDRKSEAIEAWERSHEGEFASCRLGAAVT